MDALSWSRLETRTTLGNGYMWSFLLMTLNSLRPCLWVPEKKLVLPLGTEFQAFLTSNPLFPIVHQSNGNINYLRTEICFSFLLVNFRAPNKFWELSQSACLCVLSRVQLFAAPWTVALGAPSSMEFSRKEHWSGLPFIAHQKWLKND